MGEETIDFRILGPLDAVVAGRTVTLRGAKPRALLAVLLLHPNEILSTDRLIDELWGEQAPATAANAVQVYVSQLRKALGDGTLVTRPPGYVLHVESGAVDADRFEALAAQGRQALETGDSTAAARLLAEALALWRGPALADVEIEGPSRLERERLEESRLGALEDRIQAELALGRHAELIGELEQLAVEHPYRERLRGQLILALYRAGRQAEALEAYRRTRDILVEELGIEPGPALQRLEQSILRQEPELEAPAREPGPAVDLPTPATPLLGREREVADVGALLREPDVRLVTLTGPGGIGKTRLALAAAAVAAPELGGATFVGLGTIIDAALVPSTIAARLGAVERPGESPLETLIDQLRARRLLLVLDNFEQLLAAGPVLAELLGACPQVKLLVTSRAVLRLSGEHEFPVPPLDDEVAVALFEQRARAAKPDFEGEREAVGELCARLDGLPLAIELAAARTKLLSAETMLERLERRFELLGGGPRDLPTRQQTLRTTIDWSHELLDAGEQRLFARLSAFVGGATLEAAEAVCEADLDTLASLVDKSLVREHERRFWMLETIREYALERLEETGQADEVRERHAAFFLDLARLGEPEVEGPNQQAWVERLEAERGNLRAAFGFLLESAATAEALELAATQRRFWQIHGHLDEGRRWLETALEAAEDAPLELRARALNGAGMMAGEQGDLDAAEAFFEASIQVAREVGDPARIYAPLGNLGNIAAFRGQYDRARELCEEHLALVRSLGGRSQRLAIALENLASVFLAQGEVEEAIPLLRESYEEAAAWGAPRQRASGARTLARAVLMRGDVAEAAALTEESLALTRELGELHGIAECLETAGGIAGVRGDAETAAVLFGAAEALRESIGARRHRDIDVWYRDSVEVLKGTLGDDAFADALARGRALAAEDAIELALAAAAPR